MSHKWSQHVGLWLWHLSSCPRERCQIDRFCREVVLLPLVGATEPEVSAIPLILFPWFFFLRPFGYLLLSELSSIVRLFTYCTIKPMPQWFGCSMLYIEPIAGWDPCEENSGRWKIRSDGLLGLDDMILCPRVRTSWVQQRQDDGGRMVSLQNLQDSPRKGENEICDWVLRKLGDHRGPSHTLIFLLWDILEWN